MAHATPSSASGDSIPDGRISVFWSSCINSPIVLATENCQNVEGQESLLGIFFEAPLSRESDVESVLESLGQRLGGKDSASISSIDCRVYRPCSDHAPMELVPTYRGTLVAVCMTPSQESEEWFNRWYTEEHIPMLSAAPGWISSRRYVLGGSSYTSAITEGEVKRAPKYLALHEWAHDQAFETPEYKAAVNTHWRTEVMNSVKEKQRFALGYAGLLDNLAGGQNSEQESE